MSNLLPAILDFLGQLVVGAWYLFMTLAVGWCVLALDEVRHALRKKERSEKEKP